MICFPSMNHAPKPLTNLFELTKYHPFFAKLYNASIFIENTMMI